LVDEYIAPPDALNPLPDLSIHVVMVILSGGEIPLPKGSAPSHQALRTIGVCFFYYEFHYELN
jgi:hypothetical protein